MKLSFRTRATLLIGIFAFAVTITVLALGDYINESIEEFIWDRLLEVQLQQFEILDHHKEEMNSSEAVRVYTTQLPVVDTSAVPTYLQRLKPGIHDDVRGERKIWAVLVRDSNAVRQYLAYDITTLEREEHAIHRQATIYILITLLAVILMSFIIASRLSAPLYRLASQISDRQPASDLLELTPYRNDIEVAKIALSINQHTQAIEDFYRKERDLYAMVGHEIRTPIAIITGAAEVLQQQRNLNAELSGPLSRVVRAAKDLNATLTSILVIARNDSPMLDTEEYCDVDQLLAVVLDDHQYLLNEAQQIVLIQVEPLKINAASKMVALVLSNLIRNAIQHAPENDISIMLVDGIFSIHDNGPGFPAHVLKDIALSNDWLVDRSHGGGIGLSLAQRIAKRHGWAILLANTDHGASVSVRFKIEPTKNP